MMRNLALCLAVFLFGCGRDEQVKQITIIPDAWIRLPPTDLIFDGVSIGDFDLVPEGKHDQALMKLENSAWLKLSLHEAEELLDKKLDASAEGTLVLLRALSLNERNGRFSVSWHEGMVRVHHGCLGRHALPMSRRALVARLPGMPREVYVDLSMAQ